MQLERKERYGSLDRKEWATLAESYADLRKSRRSSEKLLYLANTLAVSLALVSCAVAGALAFAIGWPGFAAAGLFATFFSLCACHIHVIKQRNYYEMQLAKERSRTINKWLNDSADSSSAP